MTNDDRLRLRDALVEILSVRKGRVIDDELIRDRSNNGCFYLEEVVARIVKAALVEAARGEVVTGVIDGAQPHVPMDETTEELAKKLIR